MAVREMQKLCMVAYRKDRKRILEIVQRRGFVEVKTLSLADEVYYSPDRSAGISVLERNNRLAEDAAAVLEEYRESKKSMLESLAGRKAMTVEEYHAVANRENDIMRAARRLNELPRLIAEKKAEVLRNEAQLQTLGPWLRMELPMSAPGTVRTVTITGVFQKPYTLTDIYALLAEELPDTELIHIDVVSVSKEQTCLAILCMREDAAKVEEALRRRGFALPPVLPKLAA